MNWETVLGLEVHAELSTKTKIFCNCKTDFGADPNTQVCPICAGHPGTLPKFNRSVAEYAIRLGLSLNCDIASYCKFDRKNYFYPDLPKAYQLSQLHAPICKGGGIEITIASGQKTIRIHQIHMEEDAGKLIHDPRSGTTLIDYNRGGTPLLEIVSEPDFRSAEEVLAYLEKLREILLYLDICDCKMQEGSMRVDVNLSVRPAKGDPDVFGTRTETKNLNSFKAISRAIEYETARQIEILESGRTVDQETRRWDDEIGESYGMRSKANAQDYRYFPDPDLLPIKIDKSWLDEIKKDLPELAHSKRERYARDFSLSEVDSGILTSHKNISDLFEELCTRCGDHKESANLITGEIMRLMNATNTLPEDLSLDNGKLAALIGLVLDGKINRSAYKEAVAAVFMHDADPESYIQEKGLMMVSDTGAVESLVDAVISDNPSAVSDYKAGKQKAFGFLVGQVLKQLGGSGNPNLVKEEMMRKLN